MPSKPVAVETGANRGIGFTIVWSLCKQFSGDVYQTACDVERGKAAVAELQAEGLKLLFHQLDTNDLQSIRSLRDFLKEKYGGLNVLVNNAGIAFKDDDPTPFHIIAKITVKTNFFGTRNICKELLLALIKLQEDKLTISNALCFASEAKGPTSAGIL
ncbi:carbonyl reductase [NADPH] 1-like [Heteronotia binoei]|uniref:carbonyl reductase [NADPH] 1-like n=1 Tax=Heteronotia binoei TaxID=13085 RepID=UPI00292F8994|nr:carbonyl reductase [NADPH] 1-like [Heteronotia binoei]